MSAASTPSAESPLTRPSGSTPGLFRQLVHAVCRASWFWWLALAVWAGALYWLSSHPSIPTRIAFPMKDKVLHATYFTAGAGCLLLALFGWRASVPSRGRLTWLGMLFTCFIGALDEYHQTFTPGRSGNDPWDWLADITGGLIAASILYSILRWVKQHRG
jgi:VanZ like family